VHYHEMVVRGEVEAREAVMLERAGSAGRAITVSGRRTVRTHSASTDHMCFDILIE